ncbi:DNA/RNA helicase, superfamily II, SNF2 family [Lachnospiraceae bacterium JC7]|nr:DNA/RNA helicase, superfamily II, SNF2 family [Lachnospiraceae bacterium JC7]
MSKIVTTYNANYQSKTNAFPYQAEAFMAIKDLDYSAIFHEQGLGKTKIAIDLMLYWLDKRDIDTVMIVTKKQLVKNWVDEFPVHTFIKPKTLSNNKADNFYVLNSPAKAIITNFETLSTDKERIKLFLKLRDVAIIIDESTKLKNPESKLTKDFFEIAPLFKIRTIMTGTPVANRPYDIWSQIYFLDAGKSLGPDFKAFKSNTDLKNDFEEDELGRRIFEESVSGIYKKISAFSVRETKASCGIELPEKEYVAVYSEFEELQEVMYKKVMHELSLDINKDGEHILDDDSAALKRLLRFNEITSNPRLVDDGYDRNSSKEIELDRLIKDIVLKDEKCIVWSNFIENIDYFSKKYNEYQPRKIHGRMAMEERNKSVDLFKRDPQCKILFATPQAAKEGLTLTVANHVIFYDRGFNLDDYLQAQDRIHRISQKKKCYIYNLMVRGSIDEWIDSLLNAKQYAAFLAQGDIDLGEYIKKADYSYCDIIRELLAAEED